MDIARNENFEKCAACGGRCCKRMGCHTHPDDIIRRYGEISKETIIKALKSGEFSADCWDGDARDDNNMPVPEDEYKCECWFIRARHIGGKAVDRSYGGICVNLTKHGCKFSWDDRPAGGRALVPLAGEGYGCHETSFDKVPGVISWLPYSDMIEEIVYSEEFNDEWTDGMEMISLLSRLKDEGKTIEDMIPD